MSRLVEPGSADRVRWAARREASRRVVLAARYQDEEELKRLSAEQLKGVLASDDTKEGLRAFIEKRPPEWKGR